MKILEKPESNDLKEEEEILAAIGLFTRALHYEIAPALESIRSNAELLKEEGSRVSVHTRLCHITQQVVKIGRVLKKTQHLSALQVKTVHGITMLDLEETLERKNSSEWERDTEERRRMIMKVRGARR